MELKDRNATGRSVSSLRPDYSNPARISIVGDDAWKYIEQGRPPGRMPPLSRIIEWCIARGIPTGAAFPIAKRIGERGAPADTAKLEVAEDTLQALMPELRRDVLKDTQSRLQNALRPR